MKPVPGYVYILSNPSFKDDIFKIGMTTKTTAHRAQELFQGVTGIPTPFEVVYQRKVNHCKVAEVRIHALLSDARINNSREFFKTSLIQAKQVFELVCTKIDGEYHLAESVNENKVVVIDKIGSINLQEKSQENFNIAIQEKVEKEFPGASLTSGAQLIAASLLTRSVSLELLNQNTSTKKPVNSRYWSSNNFDRIAGGLTVLLALMFIFISLYRFSTLDWSGTLWGIVMGVLGIFYGIWIARGCL